VGWGETDSRGVSSVVGVLLLVAVTVIIDQFSNRRLRFRVAAGGSTENRKSA